MFCIRQLFWRINRWINRKCESGRHWTLPALAGTRTPLHRVYPAAWRCRSDIAADRYAPDGPQARCLPRAWRSHFFCRMSNWINRSWKYAEFGSAAIARRTHAMASSRLPRRSSMSAMQSSSPGLVGACCNPASACLAAPSISPLQIKCAGETNSGTDRSCGARLIASCAQ